MVLVVVHNGIVDHGNNYSGQYQCTFLDICSYSRIGSKLLGENAVPTPNG